MGRSLESGMPKGFVEAPFVQTETNLLKGQTFYQKGSPINSDSLRSDGRIVIHRVVDGILGSSKKMGNKIHFKDVYPPGSVFGEEDWTEREHTTTVVALTPSTVATVDITETDPLTLLGYVSNRLEDKQERLIREQLAGPDYNTRKLLELALDYYTPQGPLLKQDQLAQVVGITRQRLNIILHELEKEEIIKVVRSGNNTWMEVLDEAKVKEILNAEK